MSLREWAKNGWLAAHDSSQEEIADLRALIERDLADCLTTGLSADWRLNIAYNAALQAATAALAAAGYRAAREAHGAAHPMEGIRRVGAVAVAPRGAGRERRADAAHADDRPAVLVARRRGEAREPAVAARPARAAGASAIIV